MMQTAHPVMLLMRLKLICWIYINSGKYKTMIGRINATYFFLHKGMLIYDKNRTWGKKYIES